MPNTMPLAVPMPVIEGLLLLQLPPATASVSTVVLPTHTEVTPVIADGLGFTVTVVVVSQPVGKVYVIVAVPGDLPVTNPVPEPIVATAVLLLAQVPPPASNKLVVWPTHTTGKPTIIEGNGLTVNVTVAAQPEIV
jgi:hypothetical protein